MIDYALAHLRRLGIEEIGVNAHHLYESVEKAMARQTPPVTVVVEDELQGTGGGIRGIARALDADTLLVINGDALFDFDLEPLVEQHRRTEALGTLALRHVASDSPFRKVGVDASGRLNVIAEMSIPGVSSADLEFGAYTGVQILNRALIERIPEGDCDILRSAYRGILEAKGPIYGHFVPRQSIWFDVGAPDRYLDAHRLVLDQQLQTSHLPDVDVQGCAIHSSATIGESASILGPCVVMDGAHIDADVVIGPYTFVGSGAQIARGCRISRSVVWSGVSVHRDADGEIVLPPC